MSEQLSGLENKLDELLVKKAPFQLPKNFKEWIATYSPWIGLVFGVIGLFAALGLWNFAHQTNDYVNTLNKLSEVYGTGQKVEKLNIWFYGALLSLVFQSAISIIAFPGLRERSKAKGWNLLFISALVSLVYGVFNAVYYDNLSSIIGTLIGSLIGLYVLFQIRELYNGHVSKAKPVESVKKEEK